MMEVFERILRDACDECKKDCAKCWFVQEEKTFARMVDLIAKDEGVTPERCGNTDNPYDDEYICPRCGSESVIRDQNYCEECGQRFVWEEEE